MKLKIKQILISRACNKIYLQLKPNPKRVIMVWYKMKVSFGLTCTVYTHAHTCTHVHVHMYTHVPT